MNDQSRRKVTIGVIASLVVVLAVCVTVILVTVFSADKTTDNRDRNRNSRETTVASVTLAPADDDRDTTDSGTTDKMINITGDPLAPTTPDDRTQTYPDIMNTTAAPYSAPTAPAPVYNPPTTAGSYSQTDFYSQEYLFPSDTTYLTYDILSQYTREQIRYITNEMYARHGKIYTQEPYKSYFESKSWYYGTDTSMEVVRERFNSIEAANLETIADYERSKGWRAPKTETTTQTDSSDKAYEDFEVGTVCMIDYTTPLHDGLNLRSRPTKESELLRLLHEGTTLVIQEEFDYDNNSYIKVSYYDEATGETIYGWIMAKYLVEVN